MSDDDLPFPWSAVDGDDGRFYYNEETGESQWERPNLDVEDGRSQHSREEIEDFGPRPELSYQAIKSVGKESVRLVVSDSAVLGCIPDGALATLSCAPCELFRIEAVGGLELVEGTGDEPPPDGCVFVDVASLEQSWKGLPESVEAEGTLTALLAGSDMEEAFIGALHRLAHESQARKSKEQGNMHERSALTSRVRALFPDIFSASELEDTKVERVLSESSLLDIVWSTADSVNNVIAKVSTSPLEETAMRAFSNLADEQHNNYVPIARERPWEVVASELEHLMGLRDENLDRRILECSPHFVFRSSEADRQCVVVRLKNPPAEKLAASKTGDPSKHARSRSRIERSRHMPMRNGSRSRRLPLRDSRRRRSPRRRSLRRDDHRSRRGGHRARSVERPRRDDHRRRSPRADDRRARPDRRGASRDAHRRDSRGDQRGELRRGPREDRGRERRDVTDRSLRREQERRRSERISRSPRGDPRGSLARNRDGGGRLGLDSGTGRDSGIGKEPPWSRKGVSKESSSQSSLQAVPRARPSVAPSVAPSTAGQVDDPTSPEAKPLKFSGGVSGLRAAGEGKPKPPPGPPPSWAQRTKSIAVVKPSSAVSAKAETPSLMKATPKTDRKSVV